MDNKKMMAVLAVTVLAIPLTMSGCGNSSEEVPADDTVVSVDESNTVVNDTIEDDLSDMGIVVDEPEVEEEDILDESSVNYDTLYATSNINVYGEPSEDSDIVSTFETDSKVQTSGVYHKAAFYRVTYLDGAGQETYGYVRVVDLSPFKGGYNEEEHLVQESDTTTTTTNSQTTTDNPLAGLPPLSPKPVSPQTEQSILEKYGFSDAGSNYDPSQDTEFSMDNIDVSGIPAHTVQ